MSEHMKALRLYQQELAQIGIEHESPRLMNLAAAIHHEIKALAGEPAEPVLFVGWAALAPNGNVRLWSRDKARVDALAEAHGLEVVRLVRSPLLGHPPNAIEALKTAIDHIEHMAAWIAQQGGGYSFESLGEDMGDMRAPLAAVAEESSAEPPETSLGGLRQWCEDRLEECATRAQDPKLAASLQLGWAMSAETFNSVIEKIDDMDPINASDGAAPAEARSASPAWPYSFYDGRSRTERLEALAKL
ncbi:MAG TPA: hypothetical protein VJP88_06470, partial [Caulobacteraceae bacterium]|nr:hypothetical protein [Caulobacteraceae bacterium]